MINIHTIHAAQDGDEDAIQQIFESFKQLMIFKTKKYFFHGGDREDVMQEAMIGLLKAINAYDENKKMCIRDRKMFLIFFPSLLKEQL